MQRNWKNFASKMMQINTCEKNDLNLRNLAKQTMLRHNDLWKMGCHTHYSFYEVVRVTDKSNVMVKERERVSVGGRNVTIGEYTSAKTKRLPAGLYDIVDSNATFYEENCER